MNKLRSRPPETGASTVDANGEALRHGHTLLQSVPAKSVPLYLRAAELLGREIASGHWRAGERLPTETELAQRLGMAVGTVRKALAELESRRLLERRQGSGTYVRGHSGERDRSIYEFFRLEGLDGAGWPSAQILSLNRLPHPARKPAFGAGTSNQSYRLRRLRLLDGVPVALEEIWFDARHRANLQPSDLQQALYVFYQQTLGFWISRVEDRVSVGTVPSWAPAAFPCTAGQPCGWIERQAWSGSDQLEEFSLTWFDPARARYTARWF